MVVLLAAAAGVYLVHLSRTLWFFGDDWDFLLLRRLTGGGDLPLLEPHNEHWSTLSIIAFRLVYGVFGLHTYLPYAALPIGAHMLAVVLLFLLIRRLGVRPWVGVLVIVPMTFLGAGAEDLLWDFQIGFVGPLPLALGAMLLLAKEMAWSRWMAIWVLLVAGLMCSGTGITMVFWVSLCALIRFGVRRAVLVGLLPTLIYGAWYVAFGRSAPRDDPHWNLVVLAMLRGLTSPWDGVLGIVGVGGPITLVLVLVTLLAPCDERLRALALSGLCSLVPFYGLISFSRVGVGNLDAAVASRYAYLGLVLTLPALAIGLQMVADSVRAPTRLVVSGAAVVAILFVALGASQLDRFHEERLGLIGDSRAATVAAVDLIRSRSALLSTQPQPTLAPNISVELLRRPEVQRALPSVEPGPQARLDAAGGLQVGASPTTFPIAQASQLRIGGVPRIRVVGTCTSGYAKGRAWVQFNGDARGRQVALTVDGAQVQTQLIRGSLRTQPITRAVDQGEPTWVGTSAADVILRVLLPTGPFTACAG